MNNVWWYLWASGPNGDFEHVVELSPHDKERLIRSLRSEQRIGNLIDFTIDVYEPEVYDYGYESVLGNVKDTCIGVWADG